MRHRVAFAVALRSEERTERTVNVADVRVVDRRVDHVGDVVAREKREPPRVRRRTQLVERGLFVKPQAFLEREPSAAGGFVEKISDGQRTSTVCTREGRG